MTRVGRHERAVTPDDEAARVLGLDRLAADGQWQVVQGYRKLSPKTPSAP